MLYKPQSDEHMFYILDPVLSDPIPVALHFLIVCLASWDHIKYIVYASVNRKLRALVGALVYERERLVCPAQIYRAREKSENKPM